MYKTERLDKAFTLIELLVVISIISLLASIVLASLNSARDSSKDAAIKSMVSQMRQQAEMYYSEKGSYYGLDTNGEIDDSIGECFSGAPRSVFIDPTTDADLEELIRATEQISRGAGTRIKCSLGGESNDEWALAFPTYEGGPATGLCVDSIGVIKTITHNFNNPSWPFTAANSCP